MKIIGFLFIVSVIIAMYNDSTSDNPSPEAKKLLNPSKEVNFENKLNELLQSSTHSQCDATIKSWVKNTKISDSMGASLPSKSFTRTYWKQTKFLLENCQSILSENDYIILLGTYEGVDEYRVSSGWNF